MIKIIGETIALALFLTSLLMVVMVVGVGYGQ